MMGVACMPSAWLSDHQLGVGCCHVVSSHLGSIGLCPQYMSAAIMEADAPHSDPSSPVEPSHKTVALSCVTSSS